MNDYTTPRSPRDEIEGLVYFPRLCDKARLLAAGKLHPDYVPNVGIHMDAWACTFLGVDYADLAGVINGGASDADALAWARENGTPRNADEADWWSSYMRNRGFRDDFSELLAKRKAEAGMEDRGDIMAFFDFIDADEGRM